MTVSEIRTTIILLLLSVALIWSATWFRGYQRDKAALAASQTYQKSVGDREEVSGVAHDSYYRQQTDRANRENARKQARATADKISHEVANESQATADFFDYRIPDELRAADRQARLARGLEGGDGARPGTRKAK